jgi:hypothetical protein
MGYKALGTLDFTSNRFAFPVYGNSGDHRMEGIFVGLGDAFKQGHRADALSILDMAPTILYLLGLPVPRQMDGKIADEALKPDYIGRYPPQYSDIEVLGRARGSSISAEEGEEIKRRLEGIGYIG